ncbi:arsenate reductase [Paraburkholderia sp. GAS334]
MLCVGAKHASCDHGEAFVVVLLRPDLIDEEQMTSNVLILCTHNSARSVLGEAMLNHWAAKLGKKVRAFSAGSAPGGYLNPFAVEVLTNVGIDVSGYRSKSWDEFAGKDAPSMRVVITVCDSAAEETCPYWPGSPVKVRWGYADPSDARGGDEGKRIAFELTRQAIGYRMLQLLALPFETMSDADLQQALTVISGS